MFYTDKAHIVISSAGGTIKIINSFKLVKHKLLSVVLSGHIRVSTVLRW